MKKELIHVNTDDQVVGYGDKIPTHKAGLLHRAFSSFIYNTKDKRLLLQKRSDEKYHSGGKWSNSFCSHPYRNESWSESLRRAALDELKIALDISSDIQCKGTERSVWIDKNLFFSGCFIYYSEYPELSEYEFDYVFIYVVNSAFNEININPSEVSDIKWLTVSEIENWLEEFPDNFTTWFSDAFKLVKSDLERLETEM